MYKSLLIAVMAVVFSCTLALADEEAANRIHVISADGGQFYAKSVPAESYGTKGNTQVYMVTAQGDQLVQTYDWYATQIFLTGYLAGPLVYVVQVGPWARGRQARAEDLALAFYKNGDRVKQYSTLDIVGDPNQVSASVSHYQIFGEYIGFRRPFGNKMLFEARTWDDRTLVFDTDTGEIISPESEALQKALYDVGTKIGQVKWQWYEKNKPAVADIDKHVITAQELQSVSPDVFQKMPEGFRYQADSMWQPVRYLDQHGKVYQAE